MVMVIIIIIIMLWDGVYIEMVPLFEKCGQKLVEYWKQGLDTNGTAVLPVYIDLSRTVSVVFFLAFVPGVAAVFLFENFNFYIFVSLAVTMPD